MRVGGGSGKCMSECHFRTIGSGYGCSCCAMQGVTLSKSCDLVECNWCTLDLGSLRHKAAIGTWELIELVMTV